AGHQHQLGEIWSMCLHDNRGRFPFVAVQPGWHYGGARFSSVTGEPFVDPQRPLNAYLGGQPGNAGVLEMFRCPGDRGITHPDAAAGTGHRTAYRSFGTSFRANAALLNSRSAGLDVEPRGLERREVSASPSRLLLMGDPVWYEVFHDTGRLAAWHGEPAGGNMLFLDGSVRFESVLPQTANQPTVFDPGVRPASAEMRPAGVDGEITEGLRPTPPALP
ncbi:MAG: H-X9-DG-CTERM domain-containing protein, partial [Planctomycetota bacterium]